MQTNNRLLTNRQSQILELIKKLYTNKEIAQELGITVGTVKQHISAMMVRTMTHNRKELSECGMNGVE